MKMKLFIAAALLLLSVSARAENLSAPGIHSFSLKHGGLKRDYLVFVPKSYLPQRTYPLLVVIHGGGGDAEGSRKAFNLEPLAEREGVLLAYPEGTGRNFLFRHYGVWNSGSRCCGVAAEKAIDDVGFISAMLDRIEHDYAVDAHRIYATGHSNGSMMSYRLACELSDRIAAIAPTGAQPVFDSCPLKRPVPTIHLHGTLDRCALFNGGICGGCIERVFNQVLGTSIPPKTWACPPVEDFVDRWEKLNGISSPFEPYPSFSKAMECRSSKSAETEVVFCAIKGQGHAVPGRSGEPDECTGLNSRRCVVKREVMGPEVPNLHANELIWGFLKRFELP